MERATFFTARYYVVFMSVMAVLNAAMGAWLLWLGMWHPILLIFAAGTVILGGLAAVEAKQPMIELERERLVIRTARARPAIVLARQPEASYRIESVMLGLSVIRTDGQPIASPSVAGLVSPDGLRFLVPTRALAKPERARLRRALDAWASSPA